MDKVRLFFLGILLMMVLIACKQESSVKGEVVNKVESNGRYYLEIGVEVTPEEYIGYDVGDEYEKN